MKLTLKQELRPRPFTSVLGLLDLKTGVTVVVLFAVLNKVAGVYGLIAMLTGAGGNAAQLTLYIYSVLALAGLAWGLHTINDENPKHMLYFAHAFFADHILNTTWTVYFAVNWWLYTTHDGRRNANSPAQQAIIEGYIGEHQDMSPEERAAAAERVWRAEKSQALAIIILGWLIKFYFAALLYSFAHHLRRGTYRPLSFSRTHTNGSTSGNTPLINDSSALPPLDSDSGDGSIEDVDLESFYGVTPTLPVHSIPPPSVVSGISGNSASSHRSRGSGSGSAGSFADFVSAPPPKRVRPTRGSLLAGGARRSGSAAGSSAGPSEGEDDEVSSAGTGPGRVRA
ncbi:Inositolphosphorylceramide synthase subunit Kei1-domain-containing protein [Lactarius hengduanensis]|nr:Inositolphosphorylceramide synthase subunit Kei1-domain-containing protein [Lactarius hengduanensis]